MDESVPIAFCDLWKDIKNTFRQNFLEWICSLGLGFIYMIIALILPIRETQPQFNDPSIQYNYNGQSIPSFMVFIIAIFLPIAIIFFTGFKNSKYINTCMCLLNFIQSMLITLTFTECLKSAVARPRPNFFSYCQWDNSTQKCTASGRRARDGWLSFPSGHSSVSFCGATWTTLMFSNAFPNNIELWWVFLKLLPIFIATAIAASRIIDHMHHISDVIAGSIIGIAFPSVMFHFQQNRMFNTKLFPRNNGDVLLVDSI